MKVKLEVNGIDLTSRLLTEHPVGRTWSLTLNEGAEVDSAAFSLDDPDRTLSLTAWHEVVITRTDVTPNRKVFGGFLTQIESADSGVGRVFFCQAQDYTILLHRYIVDRDYEAQTDKAILADAFSQAGLALVDASTKVQAIKTFDNLRFAGHSLYQVLDILAESSGAIWYVNPDKQLIYQTPETDEATFSLSDDPDDATSFGYWGVQHARDAASLFNRVVVRGGKELSDDQDIILPGDGSRTIFRAEKDDGHVVTDPPTDADPAFTPQRIKRVQVFVNTGTDGAPVWTQQGVGLEGEDTLGTAFDGKTVAVLWNPATGRLQFQTAPLNFPNNSIKIRGRYPIQIEVEEINQDSIDATGQTITKVIVDQSIVTTDMAIEVATAFLNEHSEEQEEITASFDHDGLEIGQQMQFTNALRGIGKKLKAKSLNIAFLGGTTAQYTAKLGSSKPARTLALILREIHEATRRTAPREEARTDVRRPKREVVEVVDVGALGRSLGPAYYLAGDDGSWLIDVESFGLLADALAESHLFHTENDDAFWPFAPLFDRPRDFYLEFDGADDNVSVADDAAIQNIFDGGGTVEAWIAPASAGEGDAGRIVDKASGTNGWQLSLEGESNGFAKLRFFQRFTGQASSFITTDYVIRVGVWTHVAVVYDSDSPDNDTVIYINGEPYTVGDGLTQTNTATGSRASDAGLTLRIGNNSAGDGTFEGGIDEVRLWSVSRTQAQIQASMGQELTGSESGLAALWKASEGSGATLADSAASGNDGAITGAQWRDYKRGPTTALVAGFSKAV
ncbi:MAG: LamG domain-containing protein [Chloroflexi bacterium]|nr:LamG domain-containing protein [Chloroflexota bacterium]